MHEQFYKEHFWLSRISQPGSSSRVSTTQCSTSQESTITFSLNAEMDRVAYMTRS